MRITILGTGGALPLAGRAQSAILLEKHGGRLLVDCGSGTLLRLAEAQIDLAQIESALLTHCHLDHMSDLVPLMTARWLLGRPHHRVYGPKGTATILKTIIGLYDYVQSHVRVEVFELEGGASFEVEGFHVESSATRHGNVPSLAYKFDGRLVISGDTEPFPPMADFARRCHTLIHECSAPDEFADLFPTHTMPQALGLLLKDCDIKRLILTHFYPQTQGHEADMIRSVQQNFKGPVLLAFDLAGYEI